MALTAHDRAHAHRILECMPRVKAKADAGNEGCMTRYLEYMNQLDKYGISLPVDDTASEPTASEPTGDRTYRRIQEQRRSAGGND